MNILHLDSAITGEASVSRKLTADIVAKLTAANPQAAVTYRDLNTGVPAIDSDWFAAVRLAPENPTPDQQRLIDISDAYLAEVQAADVVVIGLPIYNFNLPAQLKNWLDQIARAGKSFRYTAEGPEGLLTGKRAIIAYLNTLHERPSDGGLTLGGLGPVSEGLWAWIIGIGGLVVFAVWIASKGVKAK